MIVVSGEKPIYVLVLAFFASLAKVMHNKIKSLKDIE